MHKNMDLNDSSKNPAMRMPFSLSVLLAILMAAQAVLGMAFADLYRDTGFARETWFGNDLVTLVLAVPILVVGLLLERRGSALGRFLWFGGLGYSVYNYAFYLFGTVLNIFFPLYILAVILSIISLILALSLTDCSQLAARFNPRTPVRWIGGYLIFVALGLTSVWMGLWAAYIFTGLPTPVETEVFKLVAALDITIMVPALAAGGVLIWRRRPLGFVVSAMAGIQGTLYLIVLTLNSILLIGRGLAEAPGELPVWGALTLGTLVATVILLVNIRWKNASPAPAAGHR